MIRQWEFDFGDYDRPERAARNFRNELNACTYADTDGREIKFQPTIDEDNRARVVVNSDYPDDADEELEDTAAWALFLAKRLATGRWVFSFDRCGNPEEAAEAFIKEVDALGFSDEQGREVETTVAYDNPLDPSCVLVISFESELSEDEEDELVLPFLEEMATEHGGVRCKNGPPPGRYLSITEVSPDKDQEAQE
ncbi:MAG: hypothetical protein KGZ25_08850 [Planctomycetes bacterium]|nr:hypothetical protein [Planctomycetota bacterium]